MAARNEARLEKVRSDLAKTYPGMKVITSPILLDCKLTIPAGTTGHAFRFLGWSQLPFSI